jgi:hypothetical protein
MIVQVPQAISREQAFNSSSSLVLAFQSPTAPASPRGGCARGRQPLKAAPYLNLATLEYSK